MTAYESAPINKNLSASALSRIHFPASWILAWELPFWLVLAVGSLLPATQIPRFEWFGIPMKLTDLLTVLIAGYFGIAGLVQTVVRRIRVKTCAFLFATVLLLLYGGLRLLTGPLESEDQLGMGFALILAASGPILGSSIQSAYSPDQTRAFLDRLVFFLAVISLIYTAESVLGLGLRSEAGVNINSDFGIQRVRGPLYGSSTGYMVLLPALGWSMASFFQYHRSRSYSAFCTIALLSAYLGLGSRAGLILLVVFLLSILLMLRRLKQTEGAAIVFAGLSVCAGFLIYSQADTQRLTQFEDVHRRLTHEMAFEILTTESLSSIAIGQGYGSIWPWYRRDSLKGELIASGDNIVATLFGSSLYHSHSTLLELCIEFGLFGFAWLAYCVYRLGKLPLEVGAGTGWRIFTLALCVSLCSFAFDLFLFKEARVSSVWWLFTMGAFQLDRSSNLEHS